MNPSLNISGFTPSNKINLPPLICNINAVSNLPMKGMNTNGFKSFRVLRNVLCRSAVA